MSIQKDKNIKYTPKDVGGNPWGIEDGVFVKTSELESLVRQIAETVCPYKQDDIYITERTQSPSDRWPGTTWTLYGQGQMLVGYDSSDVDFNVIGKIGGSKTHNHTQNSHIHTSAAHTHNSAAHTHNLAGTGFAYVGYGKASADNSKICIKQGASAGDWSSTFWYSGATFGISAIAGGAAAGLGGATGSTTPGVTGSTTPGNTGATVAPPSNIASSLPKYVTCYMWQRLS